MANIIKHHNSIHKAYGNYLSDQKKAKYADILAENPELTLKDDEQTSAIKNGDFAICKYFYLKDDDKQLFNKPSNGDKTAEQTVRANIRAYEAILYQLKFEKGDSKTNTYIKIYRNLKKEYEQYFALTAEIALEQSYGDDYKEFRDRESARWAKIDEQRKLKREENKKKKEAEESEEEE